MGICRGAAVATVLVAMVGFTGCGSGVHDAGGAPTSAGTSSGPTTTPSSSVSAPASPTEPATSSSPTPSAPATLGWGEKPPGFPLSSADRAVLAKAGLRDTCVLNWEDCPQHYQPISAEVRLLGKRAKSDQAYAVMLQRGGTITSALAVRVPKSDRPGYFFECASAPVTVCLYGKEVAKGAPYQTTLVLVDAARATLKQGRAVRLDGGAPGHFPLPGSVGISVAQQVGEKYRIKVSVVTATGAAPAGCTKAMAAKDALADLGRRTGLTGLGPC